MYIKLQNIPFKLSYIHEECMSFYTRSFLYIFEVYFVVLDYSGLLYQTASSI